MTASLRGASPGARSSTGGRCAGRRPQARLGVRRGRASGATVVGMTADITLRGPGDVVAVLPYQLGYHPRDSVVVVSLAGQRVGLVARSDLPPDEDVDEARCPRSWARWSATAPPRSSSSATRTTPDASQPLLLALVEQLERAGIDVVDVAVVRDGRRYSPICSEPCCPPEGVALPDPADVPGVAEFVALGASPLRSRGAVRGAGRARAVAVPRGRGAAVELAVPDATCAARRCRGGAPRRAGAAAARGRRGRAAAGRPSPSLTWRSVWPTSPGATGSSRGWCPSVLPDRRDRPRVVALLRAAMPTWGGMGLRRERRHRARVAGGAVATAPPRGRREREELLQRCSPCAGRVPDECPDEAAAVCTVAAHVAWVGGDGAIARAAVERAVRLAPGVPTGQAARAPRRHGAAAPGAGHRGLGTDAVDAGRLRQAGLDAAVPGTRCPALDGAWSSSAPRVPWMPVMSPSAKPRFAGRQPSSRWGAPGDDLAAPTRCGKRESEEQPVMTATPTRSTAAVWRPGDPVGDRRFAAIGDLRPRARRRPARRDRRLRDVGHALALRRQRRARRARPHR